MKSVLISTKPKWCELIASGKKRIELRKTKPKLKPPFKCYIYETKWKSAIPTFIDEEGHVSYECGGKVIGEFVCDEIETLFNTNGNPKNYIMNEFNEKIFAFLSEYVDFKCCRKDINEKILKKGVELLLKENVFISPHDMRLQAAYDFEIILPQWLFD